jgi:hypothetical protein
MIINPYARRAIGECFYIAIPLDCGEEAMQRAFHQSLTVEAATEMLLDGEINHLDFCDLVEESIGNMDAYLEEIDQNLEQLNLC